MSSWAKASVIVTAVVGLLGSAPYLEGKWKAYRAGLEQAGYEKGVRETQQKLAQETRAEKDQLGQAKANLSNRLQEKDAEIARLNQRASQLQDKLLEEETNRRATMEKLRAANADLSFLRSKITRLENEIKQTAAGKERDYSALLQTRGKVGDLEQRLRAKDVEIDRLKRLLAQRTAAATSAKASTSSSCLRANQSTDLTQGGYFEECATGEIVSIRDIYNGGGIKNVKVVIRDKVVRLRLGESVQLSQACRVRFLTFTNPNNRRSPAKLRLECR